MPQDGQNRVRGPYGTNEGDKWTSPGSDLQDRFDAEGEGNVLVTEVMLRDGRLEECLYVTADPELIAEAQEGTERYIAAQAAAN